MKGSPCISLIQDIYFPADICADFFRVTVDKDLSGNIYDSNIMNVR